MNERPPSSDTDVAPVPPLTTTRDGDANAAAKIGSAVGVTIRAPVSALSTRKICTPVLFVAMQSAALAQRTDPRSVMPIPRSFGVHVVPPSAVVMYSPASPTATPWTASTKVSERTARVDVLTSVHELAPSAVR